jgi:hypothetical protein
VVRARVVAVALAREHRFGRYSRIRPAGLPGGSEVGDEGKRNPKDTSGF